MIAADAQVGRLYGGFSAFQLAAAACHHAKHALRGYLLQADRDFCVGLGSISRLRPVAAPSVFGFEAADLPFNALAEQAKSQV